MGATGTDIGVCCRRVLALGHYLDMPMGLLSLADATNVENAHVMADIAFGDEAMRAADISDDRDLVRLWRLFERELRSLTGPDADPERRIAVAHILLACKSRIAIAESAAADLMVRDGCSALLASARAHESAFDRLAEALSTVHCADRPFAPDMAVSPPTQRHPAEMLASCARRMQAGEHPDPGRIHSSLRGLAQSADWLASREEALRAALGHAELDSLAFHQIQAMADRAAAGIADYRNRVHAFCNCAAEKFHDFGY